MPPLSPESIMLLDMEHKVCRGEQTITRAIFTKKATTEKPPPYILYTEFMPKEQDGQLEEALSFIHQEDGVSNEDIKALAKKHINPNGSVCYLAQLLIQKIAEIRYEDGSEMRLIVERDNEDYERHTSMYPISPDVSIQHAVATALSFVAGKPIPMKKGMKKFD